MREDIKLVHLHQEKPENCPNVIFNEDSFTDNSGESSEEDDKDPAEAAELVLTSAEKTSSAEIPLPSSAPLDANQKKPTIEDFEILKKIGEGAYGQVLLVRHKKEADKLYAMKVIRKTNIQTKRQKDNVLTERNILADLQHPNIVKLKCAFQTETKLYFVLEYCQGIDWLITICLGGELFFHLQQGRFGEKKARFYAANVTLALEQFHKRGYIYRE